MAAMDQTLPEILWVWHDKPARFGTGSQQRAAQVIDALLRVFTVHLVLLRDGRAIEPVADHELVRRCGSSVEVADGPAVVRRKEEVAAEAVVLFDFTTAFDLRAVLAELGPLYIDLDELLSKRQERFLATPGASPEKHDELRRGLLLFRMLERRLLPLFRGVFVASAEEKTNVQGLIDSSLVTVVPNAISHRVVLPPAARTPPQTLLFVGRLDYFPNLDATKYFLDHVWPLLRERYGERVRFHLIGRHAPATFQPEVVPGVTYSRCCEDVVPAYRDAALAVVPIRAGGGTRVKILEAFALGRPVVSTTLGAEGLGVDHERHLLIADEPRDFAHACIRILESPQQAAQLVQEAARFVRDHNSPKAVRDAIQTSVLVRNHAHASP